jgi:hypothetical protein
MEVNPALSGTASVLYASYLGGGLDAATGIAVDGAGNAYLEGYVTGTDTGSGFPTTSGAFQTTYGRGLNSTFVAKLDPALSGAASLVYSTYLGGTTTASNVYNWGSGYVPNVNGIVTNQIAGGIAVDSSGDAYVTSATSQTNFPTTPGAYQTSSNISAANKNPYTVTSESDVFVTKLNASGSALVYSTYIGNGGSKRTGWTTNGGASIAVDANGDAHVTGWTNSTSFPTVNALQTRNGGGYDAFVTVLNPTGSGLLFSSYFGGGGTDYGYGIALDSAGNAYVGGQTNSSNFPTTAGAYQRTPGSGFALKIDPPADVSEASIPISINGKDEAVLGPYLMGPEIGSFTANPNPVTSGSSVTLTASNISDANPNATVTQVAFSYVDGSGNLRLLGYGTNKNGTWTLTFNVSLASGSYTLTSEAQDSFGALGDPVALTLTVQ